MRASLERRLVEPRDDNTTMSSRVVRHQRNSFSGSASQHNTFDGGVGKKSSSRPVSGSIQIVNGHPVDQRYARNCRFMEATSDGCTIDGLACVLKTIDGKRLWTLDGVAGAPQPVPDPAWTPKPRVTARMLNSVLEHIRNLDEFDEGSSEDENGSSSSSSETSDDDESSSFSDESSSSSSSEKKRKHRKSSKKSSKKKKKKK